MKPKPSKELVAMAKAIAAAQHQRYLAECETTVLKAAAEGLHPYPQPSTQLSFNNTRGARRALERKRLNQLMKAGTNV